MSTAYYIGLAIVLIIVLFYYFKYVRNASPTAGPEVASAHPTRMPQAQAAALVPVLALSPGTAIPDGIVFQCSGRPEIYITQGGQKRWYPSWDVFQKYGVVSPVNVDAGSRLCAMTSGPNIV